MDALHPLALTRWFLTTLSLACKNSFGQCCTMRTMRTLLAALASAVTLARTRAFVFHDVKGPRARVDLGRQKADCRHFSASDNFSPVTGGTQLAAVENVGRPWERLFVAAKAAGVKQAFERIWHEVQGLRRGMKEALMQATKELQVLRARAKAALDWSTRWMTRVVADLKKRTNGAGIPPLLWRRWKRRATAPLPAEGRHSRGSAASTK